MAQQTLKEINWGVIVIILITVVLAVYAPVLLGKVDLLSRGNDLQEFFWPIAFYTKQQVLENSALPFWNSMFSSGMPLLPDPQSPLFYFPNIIHLVLPTGSAFLILLMGHMLLGFVGMYFLVRKGFLLSRVVSVFSAAIYVVSPRLASYLEAGHVGLVYSWGWIPFVLLSAIKLARKPSYKWLLVFVFSNSFIFFTHTITFLLTLASSVLLFLYLQYSSSTFSLKKIYYLIASSVLIFGLTAVTLLPQLEWLPHTTRSLLLDSPDVYPKWNGKGDFLYNMVTPIRGGLAGAWSLDTEKYISLGVTTLFLSLLGFLNIARKHKVSLLFIGSMLTLVALNNVSPLYDYLLAFDPYVMMRVSTRVWFLVLILVIVLAASGLEQVLRKNRKFALVFALVSVLELSIYSSMRLQKPIPQQTNLVSEEVYKYMSEDKQKFRVFCTTRCISQEKAAAYKLELIDGYNTIHQRNFYQHAWQLTGSYWNYYTLSIPPIGSYSFDKPQPDPISLGEYNTKYAISPYELNDEKFVLDKKIGEFGIYKNLEFLPRAYFQGETQGDYREAKVIDYTPNNIKIDVSEALSSRIVLSEVWSPGWRAYANGNNEVEVLEKPNRLRLVNIPEHTNFIEFRYEPRSFELGRNITLFTLLFLGLFLFRKRLGILNNIGIKSSF